MPLRLLCPEGHTLVVSQARGGTSLRCPKCGAAVVVPPPVPQRETTPSGIALPAVASKPASFSATAIADEPKPPPVLTAMREVIPPPVWVPPPKSRVIPEAAPPSAVPSPPEQVEVVSAPERPVPTSDNGGTTLLAPGAPGETPANSPPPAVQPPAAAENLVAESQPVKPPDAELTPAPPAEQAAVNDRSDAPSGLPAELPREPVTPPSFDADSAAQGIRAASHDGTQPLVPTSGLRLGAYILSICFGAAALFAMAPAAWDIFQYTQAAEGVFVARWALLVLALGVMQAAYAIYLAQLPDWTSGWVVTLFALACAALYAGMLGVTLIAGDDSRLIHSLQLSESVASGRAPIWCLCMTTIMATLAFFGGRSSLRWRLAEAGGS